jgi:hypothetical protein
MYPACNLRSRLGSSSCQILSRTHLISTLRKILDACTYETQTLPLYACAVCTCAGKIFTQLPPYRSGYPYRIRCSTCSSCGEQCLVHNCLRYIGFVACSANAVIANLVVGRCRTSGERDVLWVGWKEAEGKCRQPSAGTAQQTRVVDLVETTL